MCAFAMRQLPWAEWAAIGPAASAVGATAPMRSIATLSGHQGRRRISDSYASDKTSVSLSPPRSATVLQSAGTCFKVLIKLYYPLLYLSSTP